MSTLVVGLCDCGVEVSREQAEGLGAHILNGMPLTCQQCCERHEAEQAEEERLERERVDQETLAIKVQSLPIALRRMRLDDLDTDGRTTALDAARRWAAGEIKGLVLLGPIGTGKTTISAAADIEYMASNLHEPTPRWINTVHALNDLSRDFKDPRLISTKNALDGRHSPLVLDDIDKATPNGVAAAVLFGAIDVCMTHERPLIVTTNLWPSELAKKWPSPHGHAIASRLTGYCEMHKVTGADRRLGGAV